MKRTLITLVGKQVRDASTSSKATQEAAKTAAAAAAAATQPKKVPSNVKTRITVEEQSNPFDLTNQEKAVNNSVNIQRGLGSWVYDQEENRYLDMTSGLGVLGTGHCHPAVISAIKEQLQKHALVHAREASRSGVQDHLSAASLSKAAEEKFVSKFVGEYTPAGHDNVVFCGSGSMAVDTAIKVAKTHTGRAGVLRPSEFTAEAFDNLLAKSVASETACVILEPILGDLSQVPKAFVKHVRHKCDEHKMLLIFDEVHTGAGRTSNGTTFWAHELISVEPDLLCFAESVSSGLPLGGVCGPKKFFANTTSTDSKKNLLGLATTGSTNAVSLASAAATLDVIKSEKLLSNANEMGKLIAKNLSAMPYLESIRQYGACVAADVATPENGGFAVNDVVKQAVIEHGLILHSDSASGKNTLRISPAYNVTDSDVDQLSEKLHATLKGM